MPSPWPRPSAWPRLALTARGLWWRRGSALTLLAVAAVTIAASALGPLYARAAGESTLRDRLTQAAVTDSGFSLQDTVDASQPDVADDPGADAPEPGQLFGYPTRIAALAAQVSVTPVGGSGRQLSSVVWRDGFCDHVVVVKGRSAGWAVYVMGACFVTFGLAHFVYAKFTAAAERLVNQLPGE